MILLDTDIVLDILRDYRPALAWFQSLVDEEIGLAGYVVLEILDGASNKREMNRMQKAIQPFFIHWPTSDDCNRALATFAQGKLSHNLGVLDALIAETAKGLGVPLHTFNLKHYKAILDLKTIQPYKRGR